MLLHEGAPLSATKAAITIIALIDLTTKLRKQNPPRRCRYEHRLISFILLFGWALPGEVLLKYKRYTISTSK